MSYAWVDFDLGEDVRTEARLQQDERWKNAVMDGRVQLSDREATRLHVHPLRWAIVRSHDVELLVDLTHVASYIRPFHFPRGCARA
jgi:hypothetical protein